LGSDKNKKKTLDIPKDLYSKEKMKKDTFEDLQDVYKLNNNTIMK